MRIGITGADGFVGRHAVDAVRAAGHEAVPLVRRRGPGSDRAAQAAGDIGPHTNWAPLLDGCDALLHLAAAVHEPDAVSAEPAARFQRVNVDGTARLAREAARCGVRRLVLVSSIKVMGETSSRPYEETDTPRPHGTYATSKCEAERVLWAATADTGLQGVVLRPPLVYGPGVAANFLALLRLCDSPWPLPLGGACAPRSLVHVRNLTDALVVAATHPNAVGGTFFVTDDTDLTVRELVTRLRRFLGRPSRLILAPRGLLRWLVRLAGREDALARVFEPLQASPALLRSRLGWTPPLDVDAGLADAAHWYTMHARQPTR